MKTVVNTFLALFMSTSLFAQNYVVDEFIIEYEESATATERQEIRNLYGITNTTSINEDIELWTSIPFPLIVTEDGITTNIDNPEELLEHIGIQEGGEVGSTNRTNVNNGGLNALLHLDDSGIVYENGTFDPLPNCDDIQNDRLIGNDQSDNINQKRVKVIIVDQFIAGMETINLMRGTEAQGGTHGHKVHSVIHNILSQAGIENVEYLNLVVFNDQGTGTAATLLELSNFLDHQFETGQWNSDDKVIINFSANLITSGNISSAGDIIKTQWSPIFGSNEGTSPYIPRDNIIMISSAGNQNLDSGRDVFPGEVNFANEVTVAGTQNCFDKPWANTNASPDYYEIAAEAENVLTNDGTNYYLSNGTSYSAPMVTAVVAQLALENPDLTMSEIKEMLLARAEQRQELAHVVQNGQVLNIGNYTPGQNEDSINLTELTTPTKSITLTTSPNPFTTSTLVNIDLPSGEDANISIYNLVGQLVHEEFISNQQELTELEWPTPSHLRAGTYLIRVQVEDEVAQLKVVKQ